MKKCFFKLYKNLVIYKKQELKLLSLKIKNLKMKQTSFNFYLKSYYKSFCFITGVKRSVYNFFNIARWNLKDLLSSAKIAGLKKITW